VNTHHSTTHPSRNTLRGIVNYENILVQWDVIKKVCTHQASITSMNVSIKHNIKDGKGYLFSIDGFKAILQNSKMKEKTLGIGKIKIDRRSINYRHVWTFGQRNTPQEKLEPKQCLTSTDKVQQPQLWCILKPHNNQEVKHVQT